MTGTMRLTLLLVVLSVAVLLHSNSNSLVQAASELHHNLTLSAYHSVNVFHMNIINRKTNFQSIT